MEALKLELPRWAHESEIQSVGAVLFILIALATIIVLKDMWRVGIQGENAEQSKETDEKD